MTEYRKVFRVAPFGVIPLLFGSCAQSSRPDIILILADDLGYGDVSCYNPEGKILTPNIDRLASEGVRFTDAHSTSALSTPSRYSVLTGRYPWRTELKRGVLGGYSEPMIEEGRPTIGSMLSSAGYGTACIGKWHLGWHWERTPDGGIDLTRPISGGPTACGFDYFFGISASLDMAPYIFIENDLPTETRTRTMPKNVGVLLTHGGLAGEGFRLEECLPELTRRAVREVSSWKGRRPHLMYVPLTAPHTPCLPSEDFVGRSGIGPYGDFVMMMDDAVGQIVDAVRRNGRYDRTVFVFASDNGCAPYAGVHDMEKIGHYPSYVYRGYKSDIYEGGHRIPLIVSGKRVVDAAHRGTTNEDIVTLADLFSTFADIAGSDVSDGAEDSFSLLPLLSGGDDEHPFVVSTSGEGWFCIRDRQYKLIFTPGSGGWSVPTGKGDCEGLPSRQLYDILNDPGETCNLIGEDSLMNEVDLLTDALRKCISNGCSVPGSKGTNDTDERWKQTIPIFD